MDTSARRASITIPRILQPEAEEEAARLVRCYFTKESDKAIPYYSGSRFETFASEANDPNRFTPADLLAPAMLSRRLTGAACLWILEVKADELSELLTELPTDTPLHSLDMATFTDQLDSSESPGHKMWKILRGEHAPRKLELGQTTVSKLMARKRPHLIPIWDSVVGKSLGMPDTKDFWYAMHAALTTENGGPSELLARLERIRALAGVEHISVLRVFDVAVWMDNNPWLSAADMSIGE